jgi:hypothetical protein
MSMTYPISIDIYSDMVCPWCYLGKRRLEAALQHCPELAVTVQWKPFELNPDLPAEGVDRANYMAKKFPDAQRLAAIQQQLVGFGQAMGIPFLFQSIRRIPNTRLAHTLVALAGTRSDAVVEALFAAYFERGEDIGDLAVLAGIADRVGLAVGSWPECLMTGAASDGVLADLAEGRRLGIQGVPFFVLGGRWAVSGAQKTDQWVAALRQVRDALHAAGPRLQ